MKSRPTLRASLETPDPSPRAGWRVVVAVSVDPGADVEAAVLAAIHADPASSTELGPIATRQREAAIRQVVRAAVLLGEAAFTVAMAGHSWEGADRNGAGQVDRCHADVFAAESAVKPPSPLTNVARAAELQKRWYITSAPFDLPEDGDASAILTAYVGRRLDLMKASDAVRAQARSALAHAIEAAPLVGKRFVMSLSGQDERGTGPRRIHSDVYLGPPKGEPSPT